MSVIETLVYDRTAFDVNRMYVLAERIKAGVATADDVSEYVTSPRGAYSYTDMNRVGEAINYLVTEVRKAGISINLTAKTDWKQTDITAREQLQEYLNNVSTIRGVISVPATVPKVPTKIWASEGQRDGLTYDKANAIEQILVDLDTLLKSMLSVLPRAAQPFFYAGWGLYFPAAKESAEGESYVENHVLYLAVGEVVGTTATINGTVSGNTLTI